MTLTHPVASTVFLRGAAARSATTSTFLSSRPPLAVAVVGAGGRGCWFAEGYRRRPLLTRRVIGSNKQLLLSPTTLTKIFSDTAASSALRYWSSLRTAAAAAASGSNASSTAIAGTTASDSWLGQRQRQLQQQLQRQQQQQVRHLTFSFAGPRKLNDILNLDSVQDKSAQDIRTMWSKYHETKV